MIHTHNARTYHFQSNYTIQLHLSLAKTLENSPKDKVLLINTELHIRFNLLFFSYLSLAEQLACKQFVMVIWTHNACTYHFHNTQTTERMLRFCTAPEQSQASRHPEQETNSPQNSCVFKTHCQTSCIVLTQTSR